MDGRAPRARSARGGVAAAERKFRGGHNPSCCGTGIMGAPTRPGGHRRSQLTRRSRRRGGPCFLFRCGLGRTFAAYPWPRRTASETSRRRRPKSGRANLLGEASGGEDARAVEPEDERGGYGGPMTSAPSPATGSKYVLMPIKSMRIDTMSLPSRVSSLLPPPPLSFARMAVVLPSVRQPCSPVLSSTPRSVGGAKLCTVAAYIKTSFTDRITA